MEFLEKIIPRSYQEKIFESCKDNNCLVVLPTGLGKTLIALMLTIERMKKFPEEKVIFLAPTKPLAEQHIQYFKKHLPELFADLQLFTGSVNSEKRKKIWETADIIFSTPQCIGNDLKKRLYSLSRVCLLIEDEAHRCIKNYAYNFVAEKYKEQAEHQRILGLTASPGSEKEKIRAICKNLSIEIVEIKTRESEDVKEYLQELEVEKHYVDFPSEFEEIKQLLNKIIWGYIEELKKRKILFRPPTKTELINLQKKIASTIARGNKNFNYLIGASICAQAIKLQHSLELLETQTLSGFNHYLRELLNQAAKKQSRGVEKLVARSEFNLAFIKSEELLAKNVEHPKLKELIKLVSKEKEKNEKIKLIIFTQFRETAKIIAKKMNEIGNVKAEVFIGQARKEEEGLSQKEQKKIIDEFSSGKINILCATSIGEEGLDIPEVNLVIFYEPVPSAIRSIQRRGRTARLMKGKLIVLITKKTRDESYYYASRAKEKKMHASINSIKEELTKNKNLEIQKRLK